jgi:hypothetical protein
MIKKSKIPTNSLISILSGFSIFVILVFYFTIGKDDRLTQVIVTLILAEPHFFLTIPLLVMYRNLFIENKIIFIYLPIIILFVLIFFFFQYKNIFYIIFLLANLFHVNRQSQGVVKLCLKENSLKFSNYLWIYYIFFSFIFISPHLFIFLKSSLQYKVVISIFALISFLFMIRFIKKNLSFKEICLAFSGLLIFWPALFFENILYAMGAGISIHYLQYMLLAGKIISKQYNKSNFKWIIISTTFYSIFSTVALSGGFTLNKNSLLILIPTLLQIYHFYYDSFIWRMSDPTIRKKIISSFD